MVRPDHLPDFESPPLDEVVIGVQFAPPKGYSPVLIKDIRDLFKEKFPDLQEVPPLEPSFETFGGTNIGPSMQFKFGSKPLRSRLWFISEQQDHLIQFQDDRLLLNWRKRPGGAGYPRFEKISEDFKNHIDKLETFFSRELQVNLDINQAEVAYINVIPVTAYSEIGEWLNIVNIKNIDAESLSLSFSEVIKEANHRPYARLSHELHSVVTADGKSQACRLTIGFRGKPSGSNSASAMDFIQFGRESIVERFCELTTDHAHNYWGRTT